MKLQRMLCQSLIDLISPWHKNCTLYSTSWTTLLHWVTCPFITGIAHFHRHTKTSCQKESVQHQIRSTYLSKPRDVCFKPAEIWHFCAIHKSPSQINWVCDWDPLISHWNKEISERQISAMAAELTMRWEKKKKKINPVKLYGWFFCPFLLLCLSLSVHSTV